LGVYGHHAYRDKKVVGVFVRVFVAPLQTDTWPLIMVEVPWYAHMRGAQLNPLPASAGAAVL
jgi:hypothetical protein